MNRLRPRESPAKFWVSPSAQYAASTVAAAGLYPFCLGTGSATAGVPLGRHLISGELVACDPFAWLEQGLITNTGMFLLGQPGTGKSALAKRLVIGLAARGVRPMILGDPKGEYTALIGRLGGTVIRVGRGLDRINPLTAGALPLVWSGLPERRREELRLEVRARRLAALSAMCSLVRGRALNPGEQVVMAAALDEVSGSGVRGVAEPTISHVLAQLRAPSPSVFAAAEVRHRADYDRTTQALRWTVSLLLEGPLKGVFDGSSTRVVDPSATALSVDISRVSDTTDVLASAAMLSAWSWGHAAVEAGGLIDPGRRWFMVLDELWRGLRGASGLVDQADALTRLNRSRGQSSLMITHSLADLTALPEPADVAKARGFVERAAIVAMAGLPHRELDDLSAVVALTDAEREMVVRWAGTGSWASRGRHPGRGKYLIKTGARTGLPVELILSPEEAAWYDTDRNVVAGALA